MSRAHGPSRVSSRPYPQKGLLGPNSSLLGPVVSDEEALIIFAPDEAAVKRLDLVLLVLKLRLRPVKPEFLVDPEQSETISDSGIHRHDELSLGGFVGRQHRRLQRRRNNLLLLRR
jgi:hypothetical protein